MIMSALSGLRAVYEKRPHCTATGQHRPGGRRRRRCRDLQGLICRCRAMLYRGRDHDFRHRVTGLQRFLRQVESPWRWLHCPSRLKRRPIGWWVVVPAGGVVTIRPGTLPGVAPRARHSRKIVPTLRPFRPCLDRFALCPEVGGDVLVFCGIKEKILAVEIHFYYGHHATF